MENFFTLLLALAAAALLIRVVLSPIRLVWKILLNAAFGFLFLWLLNLTSGITGVLFPMNIITTATAGFLGIPGITLLALVQIFL